MNSIENQLPVPKKSTTEQIDELVKETFSPTYYEDMDREQTLRRETMCRIALKVLTPKQRDVIFLYFWKNMSQEQIASVLKVGQQRVSQLLHNGVKRMAKTILQDEFSESKMGKVSRDLRKTGHYLLIDNLFGRAGEELEYSMIVLERERFNPSRTFHVAVKERDKQCIYCGSVEEKEYVHIMDSSRRKDDKKNLCLLCCTCHVFLHNLAVLSAGERELFYGVIEERREKNHYQGDKKDDFLELPPS